MGGGKQSGSERCGAINQGARDQGASDRSESKFGHGLSGSDQNKEYTEINE